MVETKGLFAPEYSLQEKSFRIDEREVVLRHSPGSRAKGEAGSGYMILAISESRQELGEFRKSLGQQMGAK